VSQKPRSWEPWGNEPRIRNQEPITQKLAIRIRRTQEPEAKRQEPEGQEQKSQEVTGSQDDRVCDLTGFRNQEPRSQQPKN
jgi:hypothetical protein